jgi:phosphoglycolate phosphatase
MARYQDAVCEASTVYPGVAEFVAAARGAGIRLACVTNKPYRPAVALLEALNLLDAFELVIGGDTLVHKKPHPEPLLHCLRHFQVSAAQALMVGDSRNDVDAARAAGIKSLALPYGYNHGEPIEACAPDRLVASLAELI